MTHIFRMRLTAAGGRKGDIFDTLESRATDWGRIQSAPLKPARGRFGAGVIFDTLNAVFAPTTVPLPDGLPLMLAGPGAFYVLRCAA